MPHASAITLISERSADKPCIFQLPATNFFSAIQAPLFAEALATRLDARQPAP